MARRLGGPLARRLALAFVAVAAAAVALLAGLALWSAHDQVSSLADQQQTQRAQEVAAALAQAYESARGWRGADLSGAAALAAASDASIEVRDAGGRVLALPVDMQDLMNRMHGGSGMPGMGRTGMMSPAAPTGTPTTVPVIAGGAVVGTASLWFPGGLSTAEQGVRDALGRTVVAGAVVAAALAVVAALVVARRITRPLEELTAAAAALEQGDRGARVPVTAPGELGQLAQSFNRMAGSLQREDELRRALVADVAHELRTPITILRAESEQLVDGVTEPTPDRLISLHDELLRLSRVVEDLESLNSAQAAGLRMERVPVDLAAVAQDAVALLQPRFADAGLEVETAITPATVRGDPTRLHQVAVNLLTNALKYTPEGGHVRVETGSDGAVARLVVSDDGPGIPAGETEHVFERFWRGRGAAASSGSGVGLAVVAELVRAHLGTVEVVSPAGGGASFRVLLPVC